MKPQQTGYSLFVRFPLFAALCLVCLMGIFGKRGWMDYQRMEDANRRLRTRIAEANAQKEMVAAQLQAFQQDPREQERVVREALGFVKSNETVVEFQ